MQSSISPRQLGEAIGVSESSLRRWADDGVIQMARTSGGHRRIPMAEAIRFIRESGMPVVKPQSIGLADLDVAADVAEADAVDALHDALIKGDGPRARGIITSLYLGGQSLAQIGDGPIARSLHDIGALWKHSPDGIFIEHRATDLCIQAVNYVRSLLPAPAADAPLGIGGGPSGDPYVLPSLLVATTLASVGWREMNLGADTPLDVIERCVEQNDPDMVWLSISGCDNADDAFEKLPAFAASMQDRGVQLIVGGQCVAYDYHLPGIDLMTARSLAQLEAYARGHAAARPPQSPSNTKRRKKITK